MALERDSTLFVPKWTVSNLWKYGYWIWSNERKILMGMKLVLKSFVSEKRCTHLSIFHCLITVKWTVPNEKNRLHEKQWVITQVFAKKTRFVFNNEKNINLKCIKYYSCISYGIHNVRDIFISISTTFYATVNLKNVCYQI